MFREFRSCADRNDERDDRQNSGRQNESQDEQEDEQDNGVVHSRRRISQIAISDFGMRISNFVLLKARNSVQTCLSMTKRLRCQPTCLLAKIISKTLR